MWTDTFSINYGSTEQLNKSCIYYARTDGLNYSLFCQQIIKTLLKLTFGSLDHPIIYLLMMQNCGNVHQSLNIQ